MSIVPGNRLRLVTRTLKELKDCTQQAQTRSLYSAGAGMIRLYWDIVPKFDERHEQHRRGAAVISRLARELRNEWPTEKYRYSHQLRQSVPFRENYIIDLSGQASFHRRPMSK